MLEYQKRNASTRYLYIICILGWVYLHAVYIVIGGLGNRIGVWSYTVYQLFGSIVIIWVFQHVEILSPLFCGMGIIWVFPHFVSLMLGGFVGLYVWIYPHILSPLFDDVYAKHFWVSPRSNIVSSVFGGIRVLLVCSNVVFLLFSIYQFLV